MVDYVWSDKYMELLQLKYFYDSAKSESFAKTAQKYMVPASSVSATIKRLESELGCKLFDRKSNSITLNANGKELQSSLYIIFDELQKVTESLTNRQDDRREIRLLVRAMRGTITDRIIDFKSKYPHLNFKTVFDFQTTDIENYDIIIDDNEQSKNYPNHEYFIFGQRHFVLKAAAKSPLCGKKLTLQQLKNENFVTMDAYAPTQKRLIRACKNAGFVPNIITQTNDNSCYLRYIRSGLCIGPGTPTTASSDGIAILDVADFDELQIVCAYYKQEAAYGNVKLFINYLKEKVDFD